MSTNTAIISSPFTDKVFIVDLPSEKTKTKVIKLNKNGSPNKNSVRVVHSNKQKGKKSEVYPFTIEDAKKMMNYFKEKEMWHHYLIFVLSCNMARRIGDTLSLKWDNIYNPATGEIRADIKEIQEDKTDKLANPRINSACRDAIRLFVQKTPCNPRLDNYSGYVFMQLTGTHKGNVMTADGYRKALKKAAVAVGIEYNIGTHSPRKSFGMWSRMLHPGDYDSMELLQTIYNHSDTKTTKHYIGLTKQKIDKYYDDMGTFFDEYVTGDKEYMDVAETPIVSLDTNDLRDIIRAAYEAGGNNFGNADPMVHVDAINNIMSMIESLSK